MQVGSVDLRRINPDAIARLSVSNIRLSAFQMRRELGSLEELKRSILEKGLLHPIIVRRLGNSMYEVVAGNRRFQAFQSIGWSTIPSIVADLNDQEAFEVMITENIQRETLSPLEEARAFYAYIGPKERNCYEYGKISELARRIGKSQEYVSNRMRLLRLPEILLRQLSAQKYFTASHAEELASLSDNPKRVEELSKLLLSEKLTVRELERAVPLIKSGVETKRAVELAKLESDLKVEWNYTSDRDDRVTVLMKRTELILKSALSYIDNAGTDIEYDSELHKKWIEEVRLKVHDAITGVIRCRKIRKHPRESSFRKQ
ncbi:MAG: ParB/RepB/Spo0J family partition protein [Nitrososphaerales archaeon]